MPIESVNTNESILGYTLSDRIGAGGYGEVWKAEAPGGILKAVKLIYGFHDENRAQRELKALDRVKELRHPFLLSLERIEIVEGRLVIVTELADQSLSDRVQECVAKGMPGIPREELIGYLADAADALDYLSDSHSLQHLDVKPENLLLVGSHVKVADFGLLKDIRDVSQSMMGGLTPTYASPEVFDGRPSRKSDQYSLAIVYQEMLTGMRPFSGTTPAQLASQHLHLEPDVCFLPRGDQAIIRRALAKEPHERFENCRELIAELKGRDTKKRRSPRKTRRAPKTDVGSEQTMQLTEPAGLNVGPKVVIQQHEALDLTSQSAEMRPTLFIGVGRTATTVMRRLRTRMEQRLGDRSETPSIGFLCIDADTDDLVQATKSEEPGALFPQETLAIPLRKSEEYRDDQEIDLEWISRRWIYNIPKSLKTEGIRPLGRLAFVDHHDAIFERIHDVLDQITLPESLARTSEAVELDPGSHEEPRVFIVASISGGIGSGSVLDLSYAVRTALLERGLSDESVCGVLLHSSGSSASERDLTVANTLACLSELNHYSSASSFPGDDSCDLPPFDESDGETFSQTYLVDLGAELDQPAFDKVTDKLAEYLYLNVFTRCAAFFDLCREDDVQSNGMMVRSFGLTDSAALDGDNVKLPVRILQQRLLQTWLVSENPLDVDGRALLDGAGISLTASFARFENLLKNELGADLSKIVDEALGELIHEANLRVRREGPDALLQQVCSRLDQFIGDDNLEQLEEHSAGTLASQLAGELDLQVQEFSDGLMSVLELPLDMPGARISNATAIYEALSSQFVITRDEVVQLCELANGDIQSIEEQIRQSMVQSQTVLRTKIDIGASVRILGQLRLRQFLLESIVRVFAGVELALRDYQNRLMMFSQMVQELVEAFDDETHSQDRGPHGKQPDLLSELLSKQTFRELEASTEYLDQRLQDTWFTPRGGLSRMIKSMASWQVELQQVTEQTSQAMVIDRYQQLSVDQLFDSHQVDDQGIIHWLKNESNMAMPDWVQRCGGATRLLAATPSGDARRLVDVARDTLQQDVTSIHATTGNVVLCYEVDRLPLSGIASSLAESRPEFSEYVSRLHTRTDVRWSPLLR